MSGAAPVPPSPPSMLMKSGARPVVSMSLASSCQKPICPTAALMPTGRPLASASDSMKSSMDDTSENALCDAGLMQSLPMGTCRMAEISGVILAAGSTPPRPGLAPWLSLISIILT